MVECEPLTSHCFVEVYLLKLKLQLNSTVSKTMEFSRSNTVSECLHFITHTYIQALLSYIRLGDIESAIRREFDFSLDFKCQLWSETSEDEKLLLNPDQTLLEVGLCSGQVCHLH